MIGKTIGKYRFLEELGRDGMGAVYKAIDDTLDREVAIKVLNLDISDSEIMRRFQAEAATLARLHHPDIAGIHEFQKTDTDLLMVMELVQGETLDQLSARCGPLPPERAAYLVAQVLGALDHAHSAGVVHRDLKPSNVVVTEQGALKVMDFGLARVAGAEQMTADGFVLGSPAYMAPERLTGQEIDGRADIYSAGVIFYKLLTGRLPFDGVQPLEMVQKQLTAAPAPAHLYRPELPGWCQAILDRALARSPGDRFATAEAFRSALLSAISEATESTGAFPVPAAAPSPVGSDDITMRIPISAASAAVPQAEPLTVAAWTPPAPVTAIPGLEVSSPAASTTAAIEPRGSVRTPPPTGTVVLQKNQFALVGVALVALVIGAGALAFVALRHPTAVVVAPATPGVSETPQGSAGAPADAGQAAASPTPPTAPPTEIVAPPLVLAPPPPATPAPAAARAPRPVAPSSSGRPALVTTPFKFDAHAVVSDGDKRREKDATVALADGNVTVSEKNAKTLYVIPIEGVVGLTYSNSKQPLWNSPDGPAEAMRVEGGAFGFLKGGRNNWFGIRTKESLLVLRVDDRAVAAVISALEARTGLTLERLVERKD